MRGCLTRIINTIFGLVITVVVLAAAAWFLLMPRLDEILADSVRREFMLPPSSTVKIDHGSIFDTIEGQMPKFYVSSPEAKLDGVLVKDLRFLAKGISFDLIKTVLTGKAELKDVDYGELELKISEASIEQRWAAELEEKGLSKVQVALDDNKVTVKGVVDAKLAQLKVAATGRLVVDGSDRIKFKPSEVGLGGLNFQVGGIKSAISALTPVVDLGQFKVAILVDELTADKGYLKIKARSQDLKDRLAEGAEARANEQERLANERKALEEQLAKVKAQEEEQAAPTK